MSSLLVSSRKDVKPRPMLHYFIAEPKCKDPALSFSTGLPVPQIQRDRLSHLREKGLRALEKH